MARRGARRARSDKQDGADSTQAINQQPFFFTRSPFAPLQPLSTDQLEAIHQASMTMLEQTGVEVNSARARQLYKHCLLYTSPSPRDATLSRMPSSA